MGLQARSKTCVSSSSSNAELFCFVHQNLTIDNTKPLFYCNPGLTFFEKVVKVNMFALGHETVQGKRKNKKKDKTKKRTH